MEHAKLSASGSARWIGCPGSIQAEENFRTEFLQCDSSSLFAMEGTAAHEMAEFCLRKDINADEYTRVADRTHITVEEHEFEVTHEMINAVQEYLDAVRAVKGTLYVEVKLDLTPWIPEGFGTSDAVVITDDNTAYVFDLKYGKGVKVYASDNTQALIYSMGVKNEFDFIHDIKEYRMVIVQPRINHIDESCISSEDLDVVAEEIKAAAEEALKPDAPIRPSEKACQWCVAKPHCIPLQERCEATAMEGFEVLDEGGIGEENKMARISKILIEMPLIMLWLKDVAGFAEGRMKAGESMPGFKLVSGKSSRKWKDATVVEKKLRNLKTIRVKDIFTRKLISPAQAEKLLGKKHNILLHQVDKMQGKLIIAPESDKRPSVNVTDGFDNTDNEDS